MRKKSFTYIVLLLMPLFLLSACTGNPGNMPSTSVIYGVIALISLLLIAGYCLLMKKRETWLFLLYISVFVVNSGYFALSVSRTLEEALWANRIAYLGSVFLPLLMLLTIMDVCRIKYKKSLAICLFAISAAMFFIAATPGWLDWYYKAVSVRIENGVAVLQKVYGPLHPLYMVYLLGSFTAMIAIIIFSIVKKRITSGFHASIIASAVLGNIAIWGIEQIITLPFEFLSISYIITELFLLMMFMLLQQHRIQYIPTPEMDVIFTPDDTPEEEPAETCEEQNEAYLLFVQNLPTLTAAEKNIFDMYAEGKQTKEIIEILGISENTIKTHNKRIYKKLGISSRKQMLEFAKELEKE